jgi:hypothetical protein
MFTSYNADQTHHLEQTCTYVDSPAPSSPCRQLQLDDSGTSVSGLGGLPTPSSSASVPSPEAADLKLTKSGTGFKDSTHWTSVLSGVTEATEGAIPSETAVDDGSSPLEQNVLLFEGCKHATDQELLDAMPSKRESDSLVALYFRAQEYRCRCAKDMEYTCLLTLDPNSCNTPDRVLEEGKSPHIPLEKANRRPRESSITHFGRILSLHPCPGLVSCTASSASAA